MYICMCIRVYIYICIHTHTEGLIVEPSYVDYKEPQVHPEHGPHVSRIDGRSHNAIHAGFEDTERSCFIQDSGLYFHIPTLHVTVESTNAA